MREIIEAVGVICSFALNAVVREIPLSEVLRSYGEREGEWDYILLDEIRRLARAICKEADNEQEIPRDLRRFAESDFGPERIPCIPGKKT